MKLSTAWNWQLGIGILEDNVFGQSNPVASTPQIDLLIEKRCEPRISLSLPIRYRKKGKKLSWFVAQSVDVSRNGVRLALDHEVDVGTQIDLDIKLPEIENTVRLEGVIVWANPSNNSPAMIECGVAFKNLRQLSNRDKIMYFMADKICSLAERNSKNFHCRPARTLEDMRRAYELVYREYLRKGYCEANPSKMHYSYYSLLPDSRTFMLEKAGNFAGTVSLIPDSESGLPLDSIFGKEIALFRSQGRTLAEVGLLALDGESFEKSSFSLTDFQKLTGSFRLFKTMFDYARSFGVTDLIIGMHPKHRELYRYLHFDAVGPVRSYPGARGKPALLMRMDVQQAVRTTVTHHGVGSYFLTGSIDAEELARHFFWNKETVYDFTVNEKGLLPSLSEAQIEHLKSCYPGLILPS
ncbi:MAG TPA: PilZ domain-containing protein [Verrucomicrobiae bacterium]|nr:PilZ domain-containing protein [Verrucomicrobiae bacterium]